MNPAQLLEHFDRLSEAPGAVPRLRRFILDLAVRGKLVEQDPHDESASKLLCDREFFPSLEDQPFDLPFGWAWSSYELMGETIGGGTPSKGNPEFWIGSIPWVSPKDMKVDFIHDAQDHISDLAIENSATRLIPVGSLLMVVRGMILAHSFPTALSVVPLTINQDMKAIVPFRRDLSRILLLISKGMKPAVLRLVSHSTHGTCKLLTSDLFSLPLPIPPLGEQHRIVAKVDELMALCERLEAAQAERETRRDWLAAASLHRLSQPAEAEHTSASRENVRFHLAHVARFTARPDQVPALRETILSLAVRGRLVPQEQKDEAACDLLKRIDREKVRWVQEGRIRQPNVSVPISGDEIPFRLPASWEWARTETVCEVIIDCPHSTPVFVPTGIVCLDTNAFKDGALIPSRIRFVSSATYNARVERLVPKAGDVVFAREGSVGASVIIPENMRCCLGQRVMLFRLMPQVLPKYFSLALSEPSALARLVALHKGIGAKHVNVGDMRKALITVPPLAEQHRIVAKVDELMALCDKLEAQLTTTQTESRRLLDAVLHETLTETSASL